MKRILLIMLAALLCMTAACKEGESNAPDNKYNTWNSGRTPIENVEERKTPEYTPQEGTAEKFTVANYFSDDMIVPRDREIVIWGTAPESENGKIVAAEFKGLKGSAEVENGAWRIVLQGTLSASSELGHTLTVSGGNGKVKEFNDVLVGDIWIVSGQSNADLTFYGTVGTSTKDIRKMYDAYMDDAVKEDNIRLLRQTSLNVINRTYEKNMKEPQTDVVKGTKWSLADKKSVMGTSAFNGFSMLGYFFINELNALNPDVPLGIIMAACGGAPLALLASPEANAAFPEGIRDTTLTVGDFVVPACGMYNIFMAPLTNVSITGMIFYQGETDSLSAAGYGDALATYIHDLRVKFGTNFELINIQLPTYGYESAGNALTGMWEAIPDMRFAQAEVKIDGSIPNYEIIPALEIGWQEGNADGAHPYNKLDMSKRAAAVAAARVYGVGDIENAGYPVPSKIAYNESVIEITYDYAGGGLKTLDGGPVVGFEVKKDGLWSAASVTLDGNKVVIDVTNAQGVRYAPELRYFDTQNINLCSGTDKQAVAFSAEWE